ncbi:histidine triad nucleotide-binding protein [Thiohalophilus sp.]|uniref:histidine triad nucleotide-binding protein n=1 Tax=Thiohalophilus sp. TaxID=3028392 RepID=UPI002ACD6304|nr:histidine triad nucleotide-binding protein [Thiohalophilus sp.]MDZ7805410.1 histidine triad nucleotide-binding protein [Thiohalophilus sp.]
MTCLFCQIADGTQPADIVYNDDDVIGFRDINPQAPQHVLFIPRRHVGTINDFDSADAALIGRLTLAAQHYAGEQGFDEEGYRVVMNCNRMAGQTVYHVHLHLLAGRPLHWPPG